MHLSIGAVYETEVVYGEGETNGIPLSQRFPIFLSPRTPFGVRIVAIDPLEDLLRNLLFYERESVGSIPIAG